MAPGSKKRISTLSRIANAVPVFISYAILGTTWIGFIFFISIDEVLMRRGEVCHFAEQQIIYNTLCFLTVLSLFSASTRGPGYVDPSLDPERPSRSDLVPRILPAPKTKKSEATTDDDIPLKFLRNSNWVNKRIGKDRPSPLPLRSVRRPTRPADEQSDSEENQSYHSPLAFAASPFVPTTRAETGEDISSEEGSSTSTIRAVLDEGHIKETAEQDANHATDQDRLLPEPGTSRRSIMAKSTDGGPRWCQKCDAWKADRAHHCRFCHACTLRMDHHCPWIGTCVGHHNYKAFLLFITYGSLLSIYGSMEAGYETFRFFRNPEEFYPNNTPCPSGQQCPTELRLDLNPVIFMLIAVLGFFFALAVGGLAGYHWWLACNNMTTLENMTNSFPSVLLADLTPGLTSSGSAKWKPDHLLTRDERNRLRREAKSINVYDLGWRRNLQQILGDGWMISRLWPLSRPYSRFGAESGHLYEVDEDKLDQLKRLTRELRFGEDAEEDVQSPHSVESETSSVPIGSARSGGYQGDEEEDWSADDGDEEKLVAPSSDRNHPWFEP